MTPVSRDIPELIPIPEGTFTPGDTWGDGELDECPASQVSLRAFRLGKYAVTNGQYLCFLTECTASGGRPDRLSDLSNKASPISFAKGEFLCEEELLDFPVTYLSWSGANAYCSWLSEKVGCVVRLPTEFEWQYAAMGPLGLKWSLGDTFERSRYICENNGPARVNTGEPSEWGIFNMTGNVFEWCSDRYGFSLGDNSERNLIKHSRVIKGGAFILSDSANLRNAKRFSCHEDTCLNSIGFRVVMA